MAALPCHVLAQGRTAPPEPEPRPFEVTPWIAVFDDAYDIGADGSLGMLLGARAGVHLSERTRLVATVGYGEIGDVAQVPPDLTDYHVFANRWIVTTAGLEHDFYENGIELLGSLQIGGAWRSAVVTGTVGDPPGDEPRGGDGYAFYDAIVPSVIVRRAVLPGVALEVGIADYMFDILEWSVDHSPAAWLGVVIR